MLSRHDVRASNSHVWLAPDLALGFHQFDYTEGEYDGLSHTHAEYGIVMCLAGSVEVLCQDRREVVRAGEILIVNPGEVHRCRSGVNQPKSKGFTLIVRPTVLYSVAEAMALPYSSTSQRLRFVGKFQNPEAFALILRLLEEYQELRRHDRNDGAPDSRSSSSVTALGSSASIQAKSTSATPLAAHAPCH
jgi:AraC-like ligand binding domain